MINPCCEVGWGAEVNATTTPTTLLMDPNTIYTVVLTASASAECDVCLMSGASVDPYFAFDPNFDSTGYSLEFSSGIVNEPLATTPLPAPVPEPSTLALFGAGLGAMGLLKWRRKRKAQAV